MKACNGSRGVAPLMLNFVTKLKWMVNFTTRPLYPRKSSLVSFVKMAAREKELVWAVLEMGKVSCPHWDSNHLPSSYTNCTIMAYG